MIFQMNSSCTGMLIDSDLGGGAGVNIRCQGLDLVSPRWRHDNRLIASSDAGNVELLAFIKPRGVRLLLLLLLTIHVTHFRKVE